MDVAACEAVDRLPVVAHAEQREIALFAQRADQLVARPRHVLVFVDEHVFVWMPVVVAPHAADGVDDHAGKIDALRCAEIVEIRVVKRFDELQHLTVAADMLAAAPLVELAHAVDVDVVLPHVLDDGLRVFDEALLVLVEAVIVRRQLEILVFRGSAVLAEQFLRHELERQQTVVDILCEQPFERGAYHAIRRVSVDDGAFRDGGCAADLQPKTMECAGADRLAGACHDAMRHVVRGFPGERQHEDLLGRGTIRGEQPCDVADDGGGFAGSRTREHEGVMAGSGDCADLFVAQLMLFDCADCFARLLDSLGRQQRLRTELCALLRLSGALGRPCGTCGFGCCGGLGCRRGFDTFAGRSRLLRRMRLVIWAKYVFQRSQQSHGAPFVPSPKPLQGVIIMCGGPERRKGKTRARATYFRLAYWQTIQRHRFAGVPA